MTTRGPIVAVFGPIGSGKSTTAAYLEDACGFKRASFADNLRYRVAKMLIREELVKEQTSEVLGILMDPATKEAYRPLLQWWGAYCRKQDLEYWVNPLVAKALEITRNSFPVVIDDCRYTNEYLALKRQGGVFFRLAPAPDALPSSTAHESEQDWPSFKAVMTLPWAPPEERVGQILSYLRTEDLL